ncbi:hypothetical protein GE21DRAFT_1277231, partial [Neurospora crassa]
TLVLVSTSPRPLRAVRTLFMVNAFCYYNLCIAACSSTSMLPCPPSNRRRRDGVPSAFPHNLFSSPRRAQSESRLAKPLLSPLTVEAVRVTAAPPDALDGSAAKAHRENRNLRPLLVPFPDTSSSLDPRILRISYAPRLSRPLPVFSSCALHSFFIGNFTLPLPHTTCHELSNHVHSSQSDEK